MAISVSSTRTSQMPAGNRDPSSARSAFPGESRYGRSKNVILGPSGENIYPELVEQKLNNMPYVGESLVLERNHQLHAMIYPDFEALDSDHIPESRISKLMEENRTEVNKQLSDFSRIIKIQIASEPFQKTPTQKIKRYLYS